MIKIRFENIEPSAAFKLFSAIASGLLGLLGVWLAISFSVEAFRLSFVWSIVFPLTIALAFGPKYGFYAAFLGLFAFFPFILWPDNGYANIINTAAYLIFFSLHGFAAERRRKSAFWYWHPAFIQLIFSALYFIIVRLTFPLAFAQNPPIWEPSAQTLISSVVLYKIIVKELLHLSFMVLIAHFSLKLPFVRNILRLPVHNHFKNNTLIFIMSFVSVFAIMEILQLLDFILFAKEIRPIEWLSNTHNLLILMVVFVVSITAAYLLSKFSSGLLKVTDSLKESQLLFKTLAESSPVGIFRTDKTGATTYVNPKWCDLSSMIAKDALNMGFLQAIHPDDREIVTNRWDKTVEGNQTDKAQYRFLHKDGSIVWVQGIVVPEIIEGITVGYIGTITDITQIKKYEVVLQQQKEELQKKNEELQLNNEELNAMNEETVQTMNELQIANERATESDRLKTAFLKNISHEIRTPMNGIINFADFIVNTNPSESEKQHYLEILNESTSRLIDTVTDFMDISMIVSGTVDVNRKHLLLDQLLEKAQNIFEDRCHSKGLAFVLQTPQTNKSTFLFCDPELIHKIISHLLNNAIKFSTKGVVTLGFFEQHDQVTLFVKDEGPGIERQILHHVFEPFAQAHTEDTKGYEGSGLGLSIVKGLSKLMDAKVEIRSEIGEGTRVEITFNQNDLVKAHSIPPVSTFTNSFSPAEKVLIVEDVFSSYKVLSMILEKYFKIEHLWAKNGLEAVNICQANPLIKLVLMDLKMPVMDGFEATIKIKLLRPDLPIIAVTAYGMAGDEQKALENGCDDYISKPLRKEPLIALLKKYVV
ncbi:MAG: hypothetical protein CVT92_08510 [Bacteroidetes bacterium HGW-Bacteroidetes-1]|jgi:PAS domain S-box-containing protein|nr:MAG: hypothetical protein CVT92_08510 [Bacteroidetes bacterium HGW-Bacteroidetes-1]